MSEKGGERGGEERDGEVERCSLRILEGKEDWQECGRERGGRGGEGRVKLRNGD